MPTAFAYAQGEDGVGGGGTPKRGVPGRAAGLRSLIALPSGPGPPRSPALLPVTSLLGDIAWRLKSASDAGSFGNVGTPRECWEST